MPRAPKTWHDAIPDEPAPITQTFFESSCRDYFVFDAELRELGQKFRGVECL